MTALDDELPERTGRQLLSEQSWELIAAVILSLATLASAWSGYQSTQWSGENSKASRRAADLRLDATQERAIANRQVNADVGIFTAWFEAAVGGDEHTSAQIAERFRPEFAQAFRAWRGDADELPPGTPFDRAEYTLEANAEADRLAERAEALTERADEYKRRAENYVLTAVLYASVLFFAGIASKMASPTASHLGVVLSGLMFVAATSVMLALPATVTL